MLLLLQALESLQREAVPCPLVLFFGVGPKEFSPRRFSCRPTSAADVVGSFLCTTRYH